jgi:hypothetical protein
MSERAKLGRAIGISIATGFTVAVLLACALYYLYAQGLLGSEVGRFLVGIGGFLWPTAIYMVSVDRLTLQTLPVLLISAFLNGLIYGVVGWCGYVVWELLFGPKHDGWWPSRPPD